MFALDLFNNDHERRLTEGAVDTLEQRRIDDLAMKMDDLVARAKTASTPEVKAALMKEFQKCKAERDSYYKVRTETMGYGGLTAEAGIPGSVPTEKIPGKEDLLKGKGRSYYEAQDQKKNSEQVNEYLSMASDKNFVEVPAYKNYRIYVRKKPFGNTGMYTAHTEIDRKGFMEKGVSQEEAVQAIRNRIDFVLNAQKKVTGSSTIDFNVKFATDLLADPKQTFYAKLENINGEPKLVIAGPDVASDPELLAAGDFKRSAVRNQVDDEGRATALPGIALTAKSLRAGNWIANGRYTIGNETTDSDGNRVFDLTYHSTAHTKSDKLRLNQPAFTLGTAREVDESDASDPKIDRLLTNAKREFPQARNSAEALAMKILSKEQDDVARLSRENEREDKMIDRLADLERSLQRQIDHLTPTGDLTEDQKLHVGDPIIVTAPNEYEGKTGEIAELSPSGKFVVVNLYNHGQHSMHLSDVEFNQYAADQEDEDDWYDDGAEDTLEGFQDFNKVEPYAVCLAGKPVKRFDYYEQARRFHDNWKKKLYREGDRAKADKITLMPLNLDEGGIGAEIKHGIKGIKRKIANKPSRQDVKDKYWGKSLTARSAGDNAEADKNAHRYATVHNNTNSGKVNEQGVAEADETSWTANSAQFRKEEDMSWPVEVTLEPNADINQGRGRQVKTMTVTGQSRDAAKKKLVDYYRKNGWTVTGIKFTGDLGEQGVAEVFAPVSALPQQKPRKLTPDQQKKADRDVKLLGKYHEKGLSLGGAINRFNKYKEKHQNEEQGVAEVSDQTLQNYKAKAIPAFYDAVAKDNAKTANKRGQGISKASHKQASRAGGSYAVHEDVSRLSDAEYNRVAAYVRKKYPGTQLSGLGRNPDGSFNVMIDTGSGRHEFKVRFRDPEETNIDEGMAEYDRRRKLQSQIKNIELIDFYVTDDNGLIVAGPFEGRSEAHKAFEKLVRQRQDINVIQGRALIVKLSGLREAETDYSKRRQRERDVDAGKPVAKQRQSKMTDYQKRRAQQKREMELGEDQDTSGVESAIIRRIMVAHTDLLKQFGPEKVMQAAEEVAYNVGDVDEIGTSDVSAYVAQVRQILGAE